MPDIHIDIKKVRNSNYSVPSMVAGLERSDRMLGLLRWRIPEEVQSRRDLGNRLEKAVKDMKRAEEMLTEVYAFTEKVINQYTDVDRALDNAADFID